MAFRHIPENTLKRLQAKFTEDPKTGCWVWHGAVTRKQNGYGQAAYRGKLTVAHRAVWFATGREIPDGYDLDHICRNRLCVNPDHLEPVTRSENLSRGFIARGCVNGHSYDPEEFSIVRLSNGKTFTRCKKCHRERNRLAKQRKRQRVLGAHSLRA